MGKRVGKLIFCVIEKGEEDFSLHKKNQLALVGYRDIAQEMTQKWKGKLDSSTPVESGKALFEAAKEKRKVLINTVHQRLLPLAVDFAEGKRTDESILMNRSYLIDKEKESLFDKAMEKLGRENQAYLTFRYIGPIPAYSFVPLGFDRGNFDLINEARKILRLLGKAFTALPARFGQIAQDQDEVSRALQENYKRIRNELGRFHDKVEMGLKLWWEVDNVFQYFLSQDQELKSYREKLLRKSRAVSRMEQLDFGRYFCDRMNAVRQRITEKVVSSLPPGEVRVEDPTEDKMVMNASLLVKRVELKEFETGVNKVASFLGKEYRLKIEGPWVPFSFVERLELGLEQI